MQKHKVATTKVYFDEISISLNGGHKMLEIKSPVALKNKGKIVAIIVKTENVFMLIARTPTIKAEFKGFDMENGKDTWEITVSHTKCFSHEERRDLSRFFTKIKKIFEVL